MKIAKLSLVALIAVLLVGHVASFEDNDFADFEFDDDQENSDAPIKDNEPVEQAERKDSPKKQPSNNFMEVDEDDDGIVEDEFDQDEFEGFDTAADGGGSDGDKKSSGEPKLTVVSQSQVPLHFRRWDSYIAEMIFIFGLLIYFVNYTLGKQKNMKIANSWLAAHRQLLEENFALVGDDGKKELDMSHQPGFIKESDNIFTFYCSGRVCCEGMVLELKLKKRQDVVSLVAQTLRKSPDQVQVKVEMSKDSMDSFVMAVSTKRNAGKMFKDFTDLKQFCISVAKADEKYNLPVGYSLLSEMPEASSGILDSRVIQILNKYNQIIESIHISDQFSGIQDQEGQQATAAKPETKRMIIVTYSIPEKTEMEDMRPLLQLVIYLIDKMKRFKLSREARAKAEKNRLRVEEEYLKLTHTLRHEAAALKKEEKRKQEKEKIMNEENVEKQIRLERKMLRKDAKKAQPKMKSMSIHL